MNVEIIMKDSKGITEYKEEELKDSTLKKQIKVAEASLDMLVKKLCRNYPLLQPAIRIFECVAVKEELLLETDGIHIFYHPKKIQDLYKQKKLKVLEERYLHFVIHGLLGHYDTHSQLGRDPLWDAIMDYEVDTIADSMGTRILKETEKKSLGIRGMYWYAKKYANIEARFMEMKDWDNHEVWERDLEYSIGNVQIKEDPTEEENEKGGNEKTKSTQDKVKDAWKKVQDMLGGGRDIDEKQLKEMIKEKMHGKEGGEDGEAYKPAEENRNSYRERILEFLREREIMKEQEGTIDKMLYSYGFEMYGDVALVEPEEYSENKSMSKIVIAIDTSGSCQGEVMNEFLRETKNLLQDISEMSSFQEVALIQCDAKIQKEECFQNVWEFPEEDTWDMRGFGGTNFCPVFTRVREMEEDGDTIDLLVYFSDGYGEFPEEKPEYPVFFVLSEEGGRLPEWVTPIYYKNM